MIGPQPTVRPGKRAAYRPARLALAWLSTGGTKNLTVSGIRSQAGNARKVQRARNAGIWQEQAMPNTGEERIPEDHDDGYSR